MKLMSGNPEEASVPAPPNAQIIVASLLLLLSRLPNSACLESKHPGAFPPPSTGQTPPSNSEDLEDFDLQSIGQTPPGDSEDSALLGSEMLPRGRAATLQPACLSQPRKPPAVLASLAEGRRPSGPLLLDWRSPGWSWMKTEDGWKRYFYQETWICFHKESTRERHGYCTLGEAFNRLDFSSAIQDIRRFSYVVKLLQLIAKSELTNLSGAAQKNYFSILEKIVRKVLEDQQYPCLIKELLQDLNSAICMFLREVGQFVFIGNINIWICRLETILVWQQQLKNPQMDQQISNSLGFCDLPLHMQSNILYRLSDGWDIINLGQVTPVLHVLSEDQQLWKKLCQYHFAEKEDSGHPCMASDPDNCFMPVSPQHFIDLFKF
uniref:F-box only protein 25 n=1 Tax=Geotrypetes seraphini TaxID=260995 RepID=A0A6P8R4A1_GEOSA|nr:F-box only protein 25 isoform X2 [Geotrypetes seraphini]